MALPLTNDNDIFKEYKTEEIIFINASSYERICYL